MKAIDIMIAIEELEEEGKVDELKELEIKDLREIFERAKVIFEED